MSFIKPLTLMFYCWKDTSCCQLTPDFQGQVQWPRYRCCCHKLLIALFWGSHYKVTVFIGVNCNGNADCEECDTTLTRVMLQAVIPVTTFSAAKVDIIKTQDYSCTESACWRICNNIGNQLFPLWREGNTGGKSYKPPGILESHNS